MPQAVRKAVFPAAGLGTRFLPATKAQPKEMLPLVDKPIIQYGVEEALDSGANNIVLVTGRGKNAIEDHFDVSVELETFLEARGKRELLAEIRKIYNLINVSYVRQGEPLGLGHAVLVTKELIGPEPFAVILGDDVIDARPPALRQMIDVFQELDGPVLAIEEVPHDSVSSYGVIDAEDRLLIQLVPTFNVPAVGSGNNSNEHPASTAHSVAANAANNLVFVPLGFDVSIDHTGGGCFWLYVGKGYEDDGPYWCATDGEASIPLFHEGEQWGIVCRYENDEDCEGEVVLAADDDGSGLPSPKPGIETQKVIDVILADMVARGVIS